MAGWPLGGAVSGEGAGGIGMAVIRDTFYVGGGVIFSIPHWWRLRDRIPSVYS
jgi:hypothetical protein